MAFSMDLPDVEKVTEEVKDELVPAPETKEKLEKTFTDSKVTIKGLIKKNELLRLIEAFEKDFEKVVLESKGDEYKVNIEINASKKEYENILEN